MDFAIKFVSRLKLAAKKHKRKVPARWELKKDIFSCFLYLFVAFTVVAGCDRSGPIEEPNEMVLRHVLATRIKGLDPGICPMSIL